MHEALAEENPWIITTINVVPSAMSSEECNSMSPVFVMYASWACRIFFSEKSSTGSSCCHFSAIESPVRLRYKQSTLRDSM